MDARCSESLGVDGIGRAREGTERQHHAPRNSDNHRRTALRTCGRPYWQRKNAGATATDVAGGTLADGEHQGRHQNTGTEDHVRKTGAQSTGCNPWQLCPRACVSDESEGGVGAAQQQAKGEVATLAGVADTHGESAQLSALRRACEQGITYEILATAQQVAESTPDTDLRARMKNVASALGVYMNGFRFEEAEQALEALLEQHTFEPVVEASLRRCRATALAMEGRATTGIYELVRSIERNPSLRAASPPPGYEDYFVDEARFDALVGVPLSGRHPPEELCVQLNHAAEAGDSVRLLHVAQALLTREPDAEPSWRALVEALKPVVLDDPWAAFGGVRLALEVPWPSGPVSAWLHYCKARALVARSGSSSYEASDDLSSALHSNPKLLSLAQAEPLFEELLGEPGFLRHAGLQSFSSMAEVLDYMKERREELRTADEWGFEPPVAEVELRALAG